MCLHVWVCVVCMNVVCGCLGAWVGVHVSLWKCVCISYVYVYRICICVGVDACVYRVCLGISPLVSQSLSLFVCVWLRVAAITDSFVWSELGNRRFGFVPIIDPINWQFEDGHTRWFRDPYRFIQWRPDGNSDLKSRHFMWVFTFVLLLITVIFYLIITVFRFFCIRLDCSWSCSLRWYLYQRSSVWDWNVLDILSTGYLNLVVQ